MELKSFQKKVILFGTIILLLIIAFTFTYINFIIPNNEININPTQEQYNDQVKTSYYTNNQENCPQTTTSSQTCDYSSYQSQIDTLNTRIDNCNKGYIEKQNDIANVEFELSQIKKEYRELNELYVNTKTDLIGTQNELLETQINLDKVLPYYERVIRGTSLGIYHTLLEDYNDYAEPEILSYIGLTKPTKPQSDYELWIRAKQVYQWLSENYRYCGDKGLKVGTTYQEFQFFSPDELLMSDNSRCGDCDDFATLFAGLMYASGVEEDKVLVVCGGAGQDTLNHCWNWIKVNNRMYTIDGVCSQQKIINSIFDRVIFDKQKYELAYSFGDTYGDVSCFDSYKPMMYMNPSKYQKLDNEIKD